MNKSTKKSRAGILIASLLAAVMISTSLSACRGPMVVSADQREIMVRSNQVFRADMDGVFMGLGRYQRYRRAVADKIQEAETRPAPGAQ